MRRAFSAELHSHMEKNKDIYLITADLGYGMWDKIQKDYPDRFINTGASEQAASDICVGLAYAGLIPVFYSITSFLLYRCFETIRTYINYEELNIKLIGGGRNREYEKDGVSHWADDAGIVLQSLPNIKQYWPDNEDQLLDIVKEIIEKDGPVFVSLKR